MDFNRCSRCGSFYISEGNVCPKCKTKDGVEFSTFKSYIDENGFDSSLDIISNATGITVKNLNRFVKYPEFKNYAKDFKSHLESNSNTGFNGVTLN